MTTIQSDGMKFPSRINSKNKMNCDLMLTYDTPLSGKQESDGSKNASHDMVYLYEACDQISDFCHQQLLRKISWTDGRTEGQR